MKQHQVKRIVLPFLVFLLSGTALSLAGSLPERLILKARADTALSPFTGYTREHWVEAAGRIIAGFLPYFDPETGMPDFRGTDTESGHYQYTPGFQDESRNAFGRTLILASLYSAGTGKNTVPGFAGPINGPYLKGIIRGTDPSSSAYWGPPEIGGAFGNQIAQAVMYCPRYYWEPLTEAQRNNLAQWLTLLVRGVAWDCNCWYFNSAPVPVLERYNYPYDYEYITEKFQRMLSWYSGSGFFIDGGNRAFDGYNFWGFQMFNLYHYRYTDPWRQKFGRLIRESTAQFMENFSYFFGSDGAPVPFGRSLSYRIAWACPVGYAEAAGLGSLAPGLARRIASGCLKYFWEGGMLSENGRVEPGWLGPNAMVGENYVHRGSPYWVAVGFSPLLLPEGHPFWTETEQPMPADYLDGARVVAGAQFVLRCNQRRGEVRLYPIGSPRHEQGPLLQTGTKYFQHAYSSRIGWAGTGANGPELAAGRSGVSLDGKSWRYRFQPKPVMVTAFHNLSTYQADFGDGRSARVCTITLIGKDGELHCVYHNYPKPLYLRVAGYGISVPHGEKAAATVKEGTTITVRSESYESVLRILQGPEGKLEMETVLPRPGWNHSHLFGGTGAFPQWTSARPVPPQTMVIFYNDAARDESVAVPEVKLKQVPDGLGIVFEGREITAEIF